MSVAKKCDICGSLYELYNKKFSEKNWNAIQLFNRDENDSYFSHPIRDICPKCQEELMKTVERLKGE